MAKKGKEGKGGKKTRRVKWDEHSDIFQRKFLATYLEQCAIDKSLPCIWLEKALKKGIEDRLYARKVRSLHHEQRRFLQVTTHEVALTCTFAIEKFFEEVLTLTFRCWKSIQTKRLTGFRPVNAIA